MAEELTRDDLAKLYYLEYPAIVHIDDGTIPLNWDEAVAQGSVAVAAAYRKVDEALSRDQLAEKYYNNDPAYFIGKFGGIQRMPWDRAVIEDKPAVRDAYAKVDLATAMFEKDTVDTSTQPENDQDMKTMFEHGSEGYKVEKCVFDQTENVLADKSSRGTLLDRPDYLSGNREQFQYINSDRYVPWNSKGNKVINGEPPLDKWWFVRFGLMCTALLANSFFFITTIIGVMRHSDEIPKSELLWVFTALWFLSAAVIFPSMRKEYKRWLDS